MGMFQKMQSTLCMQHNYISIYIYIYIFLLMKARSREYPQLTSQVESSKLDELNVSLLAAYTSNHKRKTNPRHRSPFQTAVNDGHRGGRRHRIYVRACAQPDSPHIDTRENGAYAMCPTALTMALGRAAAARKHLTPARRRATPRQRRATATKTIRKRRQRGAVKAHPRGITMPPPPPK